MRVRVTWGLSSEELKERSSAAVIQREANVQLAVIGCGYVGLVTGSCLAEAGHEVIATDVDSARIEMLNSGRLPIYEPGLDRVMESACTAGRLRFTSDCAEAVRAADAIFICVGTPPLDSGEADLSAIDNVARQIGRILCDRPNDYITQRLLLRAPVAVAELKSCVLHVD